MGEVKAEWISNAIQCQVQYGLAAAEKSLSVM